MKSFIKIIMTIIVTIIISFLFVLIKNLMIGTKTIYIVDYMPPIIEYTPFA